MADKETYDLIIIGSGPGGYVGAIRAAQLGMSVACIERDRLGGVCLNWGCIPTKALLTAAELYRKIRHDAAAFGIDTGEPRHHWDKVIGRSRQVADQLNKGVRFLFKKNRIDAIEGHAFISEPGRVFVYDKDDTLRQGEPVRLLSSKHILIATGASPRCLPGHDFDGERIINSKTAMLIENQPKSLLVIGAGAIGMEFAYLYNAFGTKVTVVELLDRLLPIEDGQVSEAVARSFKNQGIECLPGHKTLSIERTDNGIRGTVSPGGDESTTRTIDADAALVAIGVTGRFDGLFEDTLGLNVENGHIRVDRRSYETSVSGIYAIGDVIGPPWLAHVASEEAIVCIERLAGHEAVDIDYGSVPGCTYCHPQVASIGLTEESCRERGIDYQVGHFPFQASGKAQAMGETEGFVKLITDKQYGELLGCHMVGANVTELIAELGLGKRLEATAGEIIATMHAHPTLSEAVHEAALGSAGRMIHF